jgi:hypothetical protein
MSRCASCARVKGAKLSTRVACPAMASTRRLAAILAADVAGYSRLIGADEGGTLQALRAIRAELLDPTIAEHSGRLVKTTGDGVLVEFGSVVDALRCATEVQGGWPNGTRPRLPTSASSSASASTWATWWSRTATSLGMALMLPLALKAWPSPARKFREHAVAGVLHDPAQPWPRPGQVRDDGADPRGDRQLHRSRQ